MEGRRTPVRYNAKKNNQGKKKEEQQKVSVARLIYPPVLSLSLSLSLSRRARRKNKNTGPLNAGPGGHETATDLIDRGRPLQGKH